MKNLVLHFWSKAGASPTDPLLKEAGQWKNETLYLTGGGRFYRGQIALPKGTALLKVISPRPFRIWINGGLLAEAALWRFHFSREALGYAVFPVFGRDASQDGGILKSIVEIFVEIGPRPYIEPRIFEESPSRERVRVCQAMEKSSPDTLTLQIRLLPEIRFQPFGLEILPSSRRRSGSLRRTRRIKRGLRRSTRLCAPTTAGSI